MTLAPLGNASMALPEDSSVFFFFLTRIEGLRTEDVVHCTECKANETMPL